MLCNVFSNQPTCYGEHWVGLIDRYRIKVQIPQPCTENMNVLVENLVGIKIDSKTLETEFHIPRKTGVYFEA